MNLHCKITEVYTFGENDLHFHAYRWPTAGQRTSSWRSLCVAVKFWCPAEPAFDGGLGLLCLSSFPSKTGAGGLVSSQTDLECQEEDREEWMRRNSSGLHGRFCN
uniref:Uncharacterized protein n=1 Tax=Sphaerodactylus townsendi TaxID=933632 RepID=A0ACB8GCF4_9SAUR